MGSVPALENVDYAFCNGGVHSWVNKRSQLMVHAMQFREKPLPKIGPHKFLAEHHSMVSVSMAPFGVSLSSFF